MSIRLELAFDLTQSKEVTKSSSHTYAQCLEMCTWADQAGFHGVSFGEHHTNTSHYLSSPIVMGSAASACTDRVDIRMVVLAPFYSPLRLAEDLAVLTLASGGRSLVVLAAGYRQPEFDYYDVELNQRAAIIEETVEVLQRAWARESFTYQGRHIELVSPVPEHAPRIVLGGASPLMARMAARLNLGFAPGRVPRTRTRRPRSQTNRWPAFFVPIRRSRQGLVGNRWSHTGKCANVCWIFVRHAHRSERQRTRGDA